MRWSPRSTSLTLFALCMAGCGSTRTDTGGLPESDSFDPTAGSGGTAGTDGGGGSDGGGSTDGASDGGDSGDDLRLDVGDGGTGGPGEGGTADGCQKVDFLFVVDNSASMADEQQQLIASFPGFIDAIINQVGVEDFHILATDTDGASLGCLSGSCTGDSRWSQNSICNGAPCAGIPEPDSCGGTLGGGRINGLDGTDCMVEGGFNYAIKDQPNLADTFSCMARHGGGEGTESQMGAMVAAVSEDLTAAGACNDGFVRDDAILVVTVITDENDGGSMGDPTSWRQALVDAKLGNDEAIVTLGVLGTDSNCDPTAAPRMNEMITSFDKGTTVSKCEPDYSPFFAQAVDFIEVACDDFVPPG